MPRVTYARVDGDDYVLEQDHSVGVANAIGRLSIAAYGGVLIDALRAGTRIVVEDVKTDGRLLEPTRQSLLSVSTRAFVLVPVIHRGRWVGAMGVHRTAAHAWDPDDIELTADLATGAWYAVERARKEQELVRAAARDAYRIELADTLRVLEDPDAVRDAATRVLGERLGVERVAYAEIVGSEAIHYAGYSNGLPALTGTYHMSLYAERARRVLADGEIYVIEDVAGDPHLSERERSMLSASGVRAVMAIGVVRSGRWVAILSVQSVRPRRWTVEEQGLLKETAERAWFSIDRAVRGCALREVAARDAYRARLHEVLRGLADPAAVIESATRLLGEQLGVHRALLAELVGDKGVIHPEYCKGVPSIAGSPQPLLSSSTRDALAGGRSFTVDDVDADARFSDEARAHYKTLDLRAFIAVGIVKNGQWTASMAVHSRHPRRWTAEEIRIVEDTAEPTWAALGLARAMAALKHLDRRKDEFLAMLSHELRNPLAPLRTAVEVLELAGSQPAIVDAVRQLMGRQVEHMTHLIDDLLDGARITRGSIVLRRSPTSVEDIVSTAIEANRRLIDTRMVRIDVSVLPGLPRILVDATRLVQALSNLVNNAAKFTPANGRISVAAGIHDNQLILTVTDTGAGFASELTPHLFEMFVQGDKGVARLHGGLGIGLALSRHVVELHGGTIEGRSDGIDRGARFEIRIPALEATDEIEPTVAAPAPPGRKIVIIDDNRDAASALALLVAAHGGKAHIAHDGSAGIALVREHAPDVVFLDLGMPSVDGYEVCRRLRSEVGDKVNIIALTGWGKDEDNRRAREAGFDDHLTKPADPKQLRRLVTG